jgi:signal transduction histidine kinase/ActR/RegA family two-component response regulator
VEHRVLILAPRGRDAQVIEQLLVAQRHESLICISVGELACQLHAGASAALITEETLRGADLQCLLEWLRAQPTWSDFPFILLATKQLTQRSPAARSIVSSLGNVVVLERPISSETLASAVDSALRARRRQYQMRASEQALKQLNETLESRIVARTTDLARANDRLVKEIAERERAQAALVQVQKMEAVGQLTNGIAHDFNNLLTAIVGNVEMIGRRSTDERIRRLAAYAHEAANRATRLTGQLLAFSRTQRLDLRPVDVDSLIEGMSDLMQRSIGPAIAIVMELHSGSVRAVADANQLELAILNLVINARDAMPDGGVLTISSRLQAARHNLAPGHYVVVAISDTGTGIAPHLLEKVFEPFFTTKPTGKGTGLGLSQVYGIAQQSGGDAHIDSELGKGTTVELWLPVSTLSEERAVDEGGRDPLLNAMGDETILVVEDDRDVRRFMVECLRGLGYRVHEADDGHGGLEMLERQHPELLILDFAMPGIDGAALANEVRKRDSTVPIVFVTGYADMNAIERVEGVKFLLRKPFPVAALASVVRDALGAQPSVHALNAMPRSAATVGANSEAGMASD